ncbi:MAG: hypothetical protein ACRC76_08220 [Proteocatella sp.]
MDKEKWEVLAQKVKSLDISDFELGVLAGLSSKYDFCEFIPVVSISEPKTKKFIKSIKKKAHCTQKTA